MSNKTACIIGAGPAGLTAAMELLTATDIKPVILEMTGDIGGISKTVNYKGNRIDIGGHRFFSKSDRVMQFWQDVMPQENSNQKSGSADTLMIVRNRLSRILFMRNFFNYPLSLNIDTLRKLGVIKTVKIGFSYLKSRITPINPEVTLEDFFINRFGRELYSTFFRDYTEKVWGVACKDISKEWGNQRVKGLSIRKVISHAITKHFVKQTLSQKNVETSLIDRFLYPKYGPGHLWEQVAKRITERGGEIKLYHQVIGLEMEGQDIRAVRALNTQTGQITVFPKDAVLSSMPVRDLISALGEKVPSEIKEVARGLLYRDFITVGVLVPVEKCIHLPDNWIYVQEKDVKVGRIQVFNNWSPYMVHNPAYLWLGLEYFSTEGDDLWTRSDHELKKLAADELIKIGFITDNAAIVDGTVIRMCKAYPAYFGSFGNFQVIRDFVDKINNLYLIGRNGMHRYNNMDHSMLTAIAAVKNLTQGLSDKGNIWAVNTEEEYHEEKTAV